MGRGKMDPRKCSDYRQPVKLCDFQPQEGRPPTWHSKSPACETPSAAAPRGAQGYSGPHNALAVFSLPQLSGCQKRYKMSFLHWSLFSSFLVVGLCTFHSFTITLMGSLEEEEISRQLNPLNLLAHKRTGPLHKT